MALSTVRKGGVESTCDFQVIGLTGGMGAGKSVVARILNGMGHPVYDADAAAKVPLSAKRRALNVLYDRR